MKKILIIFAVSLLMVGAALVVAKPDTSLVPATNNKADVPVFVPAHAVEVADGVFSLGHAVDVDGRIVEGLLITYKKGNAKPPWAGGGGDSTTLCYSFLAKNARWKVTEPYVTGSGIDSVLMETSINTWDSEVAYDIFGARDANGVTDGADDVSPDGKNEAELANLGSTNTIAYTITWGIFSGPPSQRELVEWDMVFNTNYPFGNADVNSSVMDFQNIATHELGHALGLGHPPDTCLEETMYAYASYGETKKRTLEAGDLAGLSGLYA
jgi:hypothetical protein